MTNSYIALDLETTGLEARLDKITEIAALRVVDGRVEERFEMCIRDRLRGVALVDIMKGQEAARELASIYDQGILFGFKVEVDSTFQCAPGTRDVYKRQTFRII